MPTVEYQEINMDDYSRAKSEMSLFFIDTSTKQVLHFCLCSSLVYADPQTRVLHRDVPLSSAAARVRRNV